MTHSISPLRDSVTRGLRQYLPGFVLSLQQEDIESYIIDGFVSRKFRLHGRFTATVYTKIMRTESDTYVDALLDARIPERSEDAIYCGEAVAFTLSESAKAFTRGSQLRLSDLQNNAELTFVYKRPRLWSAWLRMQDQHYGVVFEDNVIFDTNQMPLATQSVSDLDYEMLFAAPGRDLEYWVAIFDKAITSKSRFGNSQNVVTCLAALSLIHIIYHNLETASDVLERAWTISVELKDPSILVLERMDILGSIFKDNGRYTEAQAIFSLALERSTSLLGESHASTLERSNNVISLFMELGKYKEAEKMIVELLDLWTKRLGPDHLVTLDATTTLGNLYRQQGRLDEAEEVLTRAVERHEPVLGVDHSSTINVVNSLGNLYADQGKLDLAESMLVQVLVSCEKMLGSEHTRTLDASNNLALVYKAQGKLDEAQELLMRAGAGYEKCLGFNHPTAIDTLNNLALVLHEQGELDPAEQIYRMALREREKSLGSKHPLTLMSLNNLAQLLSERQQYDEAEEMHRRALNMYLAVFGGKHPDTLVSMNNLAQLLTERQQYDEAETMYRTVLERYVAVLGENHPDTLLCMNNLAEVLKQQGRLAETEQILREILEICKKVLDENHPHRLLSMNNLAEVLKQQGRLVEADQMLREILQPREKILGKNHPHMPASMHKVAEVPKEKDTREHTEQPRQSEFSVESKASSQTLRSIRAGQAALPDSANVIELPLRAPCDTEDYQVAWICALPFEMFAAVSMLDEEHDMAQLRHINDSNLYTLGRIHHHNVVIACLPATTYGTAAATTVAKKLLRTFREVKFILTVGIGGGVPNVEKGRDIRLGDVVVSMPTYRQSGVVQLDLRKPMNARIPTNERVPNQKPALRWAILGLQSQLARENSQIPRYLADMCRRDPTMRSRDYMFPEHEVDVLHRSHDGAGVVRRPPREDTDPVVHYGVIASGNQVIKSAELRDRAGDEYNVLCFEMEAAGLINDFGGVAIRGICDYADAFKNGNWQKYAAATAAAYTKALLLHLPEENEYNRTI